MADKGLTWGNPLYQLVKMRILDFVRDPAAIFWTFGFPIVLAIGLGTAFHQQEPLSGKIAVVGPAASRVIPALGTGKGIVLAKMDEAGAMMELNKGDLDLVLLARENLERKIELDYHFDMMQPGALGIRCHINDSVQKYFGSLDSIPSKDIIGRERGGRYIDFLLPGLIGMNIMGSCMWGMGYNIVDSRRRKLLKRFAVTPMRRSHFLLSFFLSRLIFLFFEVVIITLFGYLAFDVRISGSLPALCFAALCSTMAFSGVSLLVASRTASTEVAAGWMNFVQLPMWLLSGSFFSYKRFPEIFLPFIKALPLTATNDAFRIIFNQSGSIESVAVECLILIAWALVGFVVSLKVFRWA
ncbi:MAG: ABC transporter permease [Oligoflexales bacterium]|nr:ABC transporter permease [Oligoflexales bacterium]